jgi:hypothetical protein
LSLVAVKGSATVTPAGSAVNVSCTIAPDEPLPGPSNAVTNFSFTRILAVLLLAVTTPPPLTAAVAALTATPVDSAGPKGDGTVTAPGLLTVSVSRAVEIALMTITLVCPATIAFPVEETVAVRLVSEVPDTFTRTPLIVKLTGLVRPAPGLILSVSSPAANELVVLRVGSR